jgi:anti-sigma regulatory factor (Ser/Thr protein kinase)
MFVTCLYAVLDPASGELRYANAGHNLPYLRTAGGVSELRATGMPLGLMPGMRYDEKRATLAAGDGLLLHSDGLAEAHAPGPEREMFGFPRLAKLVGERDGGEALIDLLLEELARFTGPGWEQEDDITLVTVQRTAGAAEVLGEAERVLAEFEVASRPGNEREAISGVVRAVEPLGLPAARLQRLETAVGEAAMNAIEHGNQNRPELPVTVRVAATGRELSVRITDQGGDRPLPQDGAPDLEAKLQGLQGPRGWGLFLIRNMVDELRTFRGELGHGVELIMRLPAGEPEEES